MSAAASASLSVTTTPLLAGVYVLAAESMEVLKDWMLAIQGVVDQTQLRNFRDTVTGVSVFGGVLY